MSELPNPVNVDAASASVTADDVKGQFACGPDVARHLEVAQAYVDAGYDHLVCQNAGPDPEGFMAFTRDSSPRCARSRPGAGSVVRSARSPEP